MALEIQVALDPGLFSLAPENEVLERIFNGMGDVRLLFRSGERKMGWILHGAFLTKANFFGLVKRQVSFGEGR